MGALAATHASFSPVVDVHFEESVKPTWGVLSEAELMLVTALC